jgi:hypothetical protein
MVGIHCSMPLAGFQSRRDGNQRMDLELYNINRCFGGCFRVALPEVDACDDEEAIVYTTINGGWRQGCCLLLFMPHERSKDRVHAELTNTTLMI